MTDRQHRSSDNQQRSLQAFLTRKAEFDALLADLRRMSDDHFAADPETVLWGHAATLEHWNSRLRDVTDAYFRRGEFAG